MTVYEKCQSLSPFTPTIGGRCVRGLLDVCAKGGHAWSVLSAAADAPGLDLAPSARAAHFDEAGLRDKWVEHAASADVDLLVLADALADESPAAEAFAHGLRMAVSCRPLGLMLPAPSDGLWAPRWSLSGAAERALSPSRYARANVHSRYAPGWPFAWEALYLAQMVDLGEPTDCLARGVGWPATWRSGWVVGGVSYIDAMLFLTYLLPGMPRVFAAAAMAGVAGVASEL